MNQQEHTTGRPLVYGNVALALGVVSIQGFAWSVYLWITSSDYLWLLLGTAAAAAGTLAAIGGVASGLASRASARRMKVDRVSQGIWGLWISSLSAVLLVAAVVFNLLMLSESRDVESGPRGTMASGETERDTRSDEAIDSPNVVPQYRSVASVCDSLSNSLDRIQAISDETDYGALAIEWSAMAASLEVGADKVAPSEREFASDALAFAALSSEIASVLRSLAENPTKKKGRRLQRLTQEAPSIAVPLTDRCSVPGDNAVESEGSSDAQDSGEFDMSTYVALVTYWDYATSTTERYNACNMYTPSSSTYQPDRALNGVFVGLNSYLDRTGFDVIPGGEGFVKVWDRVYRERCNGKYPCDLSDTGDEYGNVISCDVLQRRNLQD